MSLKTNTSRRGVASVLGTVFFVLVFMLALGAMAYAYSLQGQASQAWQAADQVASRRAAEDIILAAGSGGLSAADAGPATASINHIILKFPNGTVYSLPASTALASGGSVAVQTLLPAGLCLPGTATCQSKYNQIVSGNPPGSSVGLVTSLGNTFWYDPAVSGGPATSFYYSTGTASTSSSSLSLVPGFSFTGSAGGVYLASLQLGYYQSSGTSNLAYFGVSAPADAKILACADVSASTNPYQPSCSPVAGTQLAQPTCYALAPNPVCSYSLTLFVAFGPSGGTVQLEFKSNGGVTVFVVQGSYMLMTELT